MRARTGSAVGVFSSSFLLSPPASHVQHEARRPALAPLSLLCPLIHHLSYSNHYTSPFFVLCIYVKNS